MGFEAKHLLLDEVIEHFLDKGSLKHEFARSRWDKYETEFLAHHMPRLDEQFINHAYALEVNSKRFSCRINATLDGYIVNGVRGIKPEKKGNFEEFATCFELKFFAQNKLINFLDQYTSSNDRN